MVKRSLMIHYTQVANVTDSYCYTLSYTDAN